MHSPTVTGFERDGFERRHAHNRGRHGTLRRACPIGVLASDDDGTPDDQGNRPTVPNHGQLDTDDDGVRDACDPQTLGPENLQMRRGKKLLVTDSAGDAAKRSLQVQSKDSGITTLNPTRRGAPLPLVSRAARDPTLPASGSKGLGRPPGANGSQ